MSKPHLYTLFTPKLIDLYDMKNSVVLIIDVFRATSTIATALYNGAKQVIPVEKVETCIEVGKKLPNAITAGERDGKVIEGLEYGNSPGEYPRSFIEGKTLVLTTTNGTKFLHQAVKKEASTIITGSFPNLSAVARFLKEQPQPLNVFLGCSGWKDRINLEDVLFAGAVINEVKNHFTIHCDSSLMACQLYQNNQYDIYSFVRQSTHWHRLAQYGLDKELDYCLTKDVANILPIYKEGALVIEK